LIAFLFDCSSAILDYDCSSAVLDYDGDDFGDIEMEDVEEEK
jgi:hypothetical protein